MSAATPASGHRTYRAYALIWQGVQKAAATRQPAAWPTLYHGKDNGNRAWNTRNRVWVAIQAGAVKPDQDMGFPRTAPRPYPEDRRLGAVVGVASVTDVVAASAQRQARIRECLRQE